MGGYNNAKSGGLTFLRIVGPAGIDEFALVSRPKLPRWQILLIPKWEQRHSGPTLQLSNHLLKPSGQSPVNDRAGPGIVALNLGDSAATERERNTGTEDTPQKRIGRGRTTAAPFRTISAMDAQPRDSPWLADNIPMQAFLYL